MLDIQVDDGDRAHCLVRVVGELDMGTVPALVNRVTQVLDTTELTGIVIDLGELRFCDAAGLSSLLVCRKLAERAGCHLTVRRPHGIVEVVLQLTGTASTLGLPEVPEHVRMTAPAADCETL